MFIVLKVICIYTCGFQLKDGKVQLNDLELNPKELTVALSEGTSFTSRMKREMKE